MKPKMCYEPIEIKIPGDHPTRPNVLFGCGLEKYHHGPHLIYSSIEEVAVTDTPQLPDDVRRFLVDVSCYPAQNTQQRLAKDLLDKYVPPEPEWLPGDVIFYGDAVWVRNPVGNWIRQPRSRNNLDSAYYIDSQIEYWTEAIVLVKRGKPNRGFYMKELNLT